MNLVNLVFKNGGDDPDATPNFVADRLARIFAEQGIDSLPEYTTSTRLMPSVLVDSDLLALEPSKMQDILQTMTGIYAAHYMQAIAVSINVDGINTIRLLDQFATSRSPIRNTARGDLPDFFKAMAGTESIDLPLWSMEADDSKQRSNKSKNPSGTVDAKTSEKAYGGHNLAIGRLLNVRVSSGEHSTTIPVQLSISPRVISPDMIPKTLAAVNSDDSFMGRYHQYRSGEIESFADYIFGLDIIERDRRLLMSKTNDIYKDANRRKYQSIADRILSGGEKSFNAASMMAVITKNAADELEYALKGRLRNVSVRDEYFKTTYGMMLVVVDMRKERLTIYQRGIDTHGNYTFDDVKNNGQDSKAMDLTSILKAYELGNNPTL